jgi:hypothetical protein
MDKGSGLSEPEFYALPPRFVVLGHAELNFELERAGNTQEDTLLVLYQ